MEFGFELSINIISQADSQFFGNFSIEFGFEFSVELFMEFRAQSFVQFRLDLCFQFVKVDGMVFQNNFVKNVCCVMQIAVQPIQPVGYVIYRINRDGCWCFGVGSDNVKVYSLDYFVGQLDKWACPALSVITF